MFANGFGQLKVDPAAELLGTGFMRYYTPDVHGLVKVDGQQAVILAIATTRPGTGQLRQFISNLKQLYQIVAVWDVSVPHLAEALSRYGFESKTKTQDGTTMTIFQWSSQSLREKS